MALQRWYQDFLHDLHNIGNDPPWILDSEKRIRRGHSTQAECPLSAVTNKRIGKHLPIYMIEMFSFHLNITADQVEQIIRSSDNLKDNVYFDRELRIALLEATGLAHKENV